MGLAPGTILGQYEIRSPLGAGGMGEVYRAHDKRLDREVAIKTLPEYVTSDPDRLRRFEQEARVTAALNHPNILAVYQMATDNAVSFLVEELLDGEALRDRLRRGRIPLRQAIDYSVQIAHGLAATHDKGIVHRDLKPENLFVTKDGRVKILDFGLARVGGSKTASEQEQTVTMKTEPGVVLGTAGYMSPEQVRGQAADARSDIFALGSVLYEMLSGKPAFRRATSAETMSAILNEDPPAISQVTPDLPPGLQRLVNRCLAKSPEQRFQHASDVAFALEALSDSLNPLKGTPHLTLKHSLLPKGNFKGRPKKWTWFVMGATLLVLGSTLAFVRLLRKSAEAPSSAAESIPLVSMPGQQVEATVSPDGKQIAFVEGGQSRTQRRGDFVQGPIYITLVNGGKPLQLTQNEDSDPTWSPDGSQIAFARYSDNQKSLYIMPALGGSEHRVYTLPTATFAECGRLDWSSDGKFLVFPESVDDGTRSRLTMLSLSDLTIRPLTLPSNQQFDCEPALSPDGATVAFVRGPLGGFLGDLFVVKVAGGDPVRLTSANSGGAPAWTADGKEIVFSSPVGGLRTLWRVSAFGGTPQPVAGAVENAVNPSISRRTNQLVYTQYTFDDTIWRLDLKDDRHVAGAPVRLISSRGTNLKPSFSPDGKKIAFESDRLGYLEVWMCDSDGSNCSQLTSLHGQSGTPRWSPDGRFIAFESISKDFYNIYLLEVAGGVPRLLPTFPDANNGAPNWSRDGKWVYFYSAHEKGPYQLWKVPFQRGVPVRVTKNGGVYAIESYDGHFVYYTGSRQPGVWKMPVEGGEEIRVLDQPDDWNNWAIGPTGIYFVNRIGQPNGRIEFFDFATRSTIPLFTPEKLLWIFGGPALSPDGKSLLFGQTEAAEGYVMLLKNFH